MTQPQRQPQRAQGAGSVEGKVVVTPGHPRGERRWRIVKPVNVPPEDSARLGAMSIFTSVVLIVVTLLAAYLLWSLLLRAEHLYARLEGHGQTAADIAGVAFLALTAVIVFGALAALRIEAGQLISALFH